LRLKVGLPAWAISDGSYPDFETGQEYVFGLEFYARELRRALVPLKRLRHLRSSDYAFRGRVLHAGPHLYAIDAGVRCHCDRAVHNAPETGAFVSGRFYLGVAPHGPDSLAAFEELPPMTYKWRVEEVLLDTTPLTASVDDHGGTFLTRAAGLRSFDSVPRTNAEHGDSGDEYVLDCTLLGLAL